MRDWIEWKGGNQPIGDEAMVDVKFKDTVVPLHWPSAWQWRWVSTTNEPDDSDITAYRISEPEGSKN